MAVDLTPIYAGHPSSGVSCLLSVDGKVEPNKPWTGVYIVSDLTQAPGQIASLAQLFAQFENRRPFNLLAFLYFAASAAPTPDKIGAALDAIAWRAARNNGLVAWIADPMAITQSSIDAAPRLPLEPYAPSPRSPTIPSLIRPEQQPLLPLAPGQTGGESLFITAGDRITIGANGTGDALMLTAPGLAVARGTAQADPQKFIATGMASIQIPVAAALNGCLTFDGALAAAISGIGLGFEFGLTAEDSPTPSGAIAYPLLNTLDGLAGRSASVALSILAPLDIMQCYVSLKPDGGPIRSAFRTLLDRVLLLTPQTDGSSRLVFNPGFGGTRYLTPDGSFAMSIDGGAEPNQYGLGNQLLCGLSGVEYIHFAIGDLLQFYSGNNASVTVQIDPDLPKPADITFAFDPSGPTQTAWAMVLPANASQPDTRQYYSEPDQAPFFAKSGLSADPLQLGFYGLSLSALPDSAGLPAPHQFPLLPYGAFVPAAAGFGADPVYVETFEFQLINPFRKALIEAMSASGSPTSHTGQDTTNISAITPEGYAADFVRGNWQRLRVAQMNSADADIEITFGLIPSLVTPDPPPLPQALQDAFLTNQQFLVITSPKNLGAFTCQITMDQWPFHIDLSKNTSVGDYRNVILFKSANATVTQLAQHPELWTRYGDFNNTTGDPDGRFLSNWLVDYLQNAKDLYAHGKGVASLQDFCDLIEDPNWNGFLALKVDIETKGLPPPVEALLAGIDQSLFVAHHIGNQVNHVTPPADAAHDYTLNSAMFGLVHYVDPALGSQVNNIPSYISNPQPYDFKVLTLEAVFENAKLLTFSNKSLLTLNSLFGDTVLQNDAAGDAGANTLVLIGTYNRNHDPAYTFSTAKGAIADFYLASNALGRVEITRTTMTVTEVTSIETNVTGERQCSSTTKIILPPAGSTAYLARFNLSGNLRFAADPMFDLLSYDYLGFQNLGLDMYLVTRGADRSFAFDSAAMRVALAQNIAVDPKVSSTGRSDAGSNKVRIGSLLSQFPLQLTGFVTTCSGRLPDAMGYRKLETLEPSGIMPATLNGGWYALSFDLNLGGQGALGQNGGLSAQMLLAWSPGGQPYRPSILPALKIAGPGGVSLSFDLEGVVKFGAADIVLNKMKSVDNTPDQYVLMFESIAFSVLSFSFPPKGSTNIFLFGDADPNAPPGTVLKPTLGWFGGYVEQPAKS